MKRIYPGFHQWWRDKQQPSEHEQEQRIPAQIWPSEGFVEQQPQNTDRSDYGSLVIPW
jgi:hypothetical protein